MNRMQKIAWYNLIVIVTTLAASGATVGLLAIFFGMPIALAGLGFLGIAGFLGLSPVLFRKKQGDVDFDERDVLINRKATVIAYSIFWLFFTAACMVPFLVLGRGATIRIVVLPIMLGSGYVIFQLTQSIVILILYGKGEKS